MSGIGAPFDDLFFANPKHLCPLWQGRHTLELLAIDKQRGWNSAHLSILVTLPGSGDSQ